MDHVQRLRLTRRVATFLLLILMPSGHIRATDGSLDIPIAQFTARFGGEMLALCTKLNRPCGAELIPGYRMKLREPQKQAKLNRKKATANEILDAIVLRHPGHRWIMRDGILNFEPKAQKGEDLLARRVNHVSIRGKSSFHAFEIVLAQAGLRSGAIYSGPPKLFALIDLELKNVTVREALNATVKADGQAMWIFEPSEGRSYVLDLLPWRRSGGVDEAGNPRKLYGK